ncbi:MAG: 2-amino-4-hydroxy-6-hydroxymethyldihydropteridine diphosphokinase [Magnetococcales bacterium]|nr:2-amino-4-hydroxy-6-hydroxymethyldihydropteridine diphosphokinase [Magnetococcales bacterium]NGZ26740.1 2-amino-4-hydroxy-6-hydroxymethyldihydropteridine diphosphokinase [Magnetococcales bacterium]
MVATKSSPLLIAFGANIEPLVNLHKGLTLLHDSLGVVAISTVYRTAPLGEIPQPDYLNGALLCQAQLPYQQLKPLLREIENQCGRVRGGHPYAPRPLDLDIAMMGETVLSTPPLPDPDILERPFLLHALAQLAPDLNHPLLHTTLAQLAATLHPEAPPLVVDREATRTLQGILL